MKNILHFYFFYFEQLVGKKEYSDAKAQLASVIDKAAVDEKKRQDVLLQFVEDENEYVTRMALMALGRLRYPGIEKLVQQFWNQPNEHMKMACLQALKEKASPELKEYMQKALKEKSELIRTFVEKMNVDNDFGHILDNIADYALIRHKNPIHLSLYHIKSHSHVLIDADAATYKKLFDELHSRGIRVANSIDEVKDESYRPFYLKWDEEKKDYVKVYRGKTN